MEEETREPRKQLKLSLVCNDAILGMAEAIELMGCVLVTLGIDSTWNLLR